MEEADRTRVAAREAVRDVEPPDLRAAIADRLGGGSAVPGVLTILSARAATGHADGEALERRAAGVQLIYEGLSLTRELVDAEPWRGDVGDAERPADLEVLAADVLVARGFRLLARTGAADAAVRTVREFGRERTDARAGREPTAQSLEASVFDLAAVAGATAAGSETPLALRQYLVGLAASRGDPPLAAAEDVLPEAVLDVMGRVTGPPAADPEDALRPSATDH